MKSNPDLVYLLSSLENKRFLRIGLFAFVLLAYGIGVVQDAYWGIRYLSALLADGRGDGSFPFMLGWTGLMLWGVLQPIRRRAVLLLTSVLVCFMLADGAIRFALGALPQFPFVRLAGIALWLGGYGASCFLAALRPRDTAPAGRPTHQYDDA